MATYIGQNLTQGSRQRVSYTATLNQTTFSAGYAPGFVDVYQNGLLLPTSEYTATNGSTVVLNTGAALNDEIEIIGQFLFAVEDTVSSSSGGTFSGAVTIDSNLTVSGYLAGPATFTIDPAGVGDNSGTVVIAGNLQVDGTTTTINSTTLDVDDLNITVASGAADSAAANGAGITVDGASATLTYVSAGDNWNFNKDLDINGGLTLSGNISVSDSGKINFGASNDLQIYHDSTHSYIVDSGSGQLRLRSSSAMVFQNFDGSKGYATFTDGADVKLYYNGSEKFATTATGIDVTGTVVADGLTVDDQGGTGPAVTISGGGTNTDTPANNEQTLYLKTRNGTTSLSTGIGFWGTFENFPSDTNARRAADIRAGFDGGTWGNEYLSFHTGVGTSTSNDAAAMTDERLRITNTAVIATGVIEDSVSNVRTPRYTAISTTANIEDEGVYYCTNAPTLTLGAPEVGAVMTIYNNNASSMTLNRGSTLVTMRIGADNNNTNNTSLTLGAYSTTTITMFLANFALVTGTDVS